MAGPETIRRAGPADAAALAHFAERNFRAAFGPANRAADVDQYCARSYGETLQRAEILDHSVITLLAEEDGELVGYAQLGWDPLPPSVAGDSPIQIRRFYVDPSRHGQGLAQRLMSKSLALAGAGGADRIWLGVWEKNERGIAFYRKAGFEPCGEQAFLLGSDLQRDLLLARSVGAEPADGG